MSVNRSARRLSPRHLSPWQAQHMLMGLSMTVIFHQIWMLEQQLPVKVVFTLC